MAGPPRELTPKEREALERHQANRQARKAGVEANRERRMADRRSRAALCDKVAHRLKAAGCIAVTVKPMGHLMSVGFTDADGVVHGRSFDDRAKLEAFLKTLVETGEPVAEDPPPPTIAAGAFANAPAITDIVVDGVTYSLTPADALKISGAGMLVLSRGEISVTLESGQQLTITRKNIDDVGAQLAGVAIAEKEKGQP